MTTTLIWNQFQDKLYGFIKSKVNNQEDAKDILQDVFIKIHLKIESLTNPEKLTSWIYQITRNQINDFYRGTKNEVNLSEGFEIANEQKEDSPYCISSCLEPFTKQLDPKYQQALIETNYGTTSQKEFAEQYGLSYSTAKSRVQRAKKELKEIFMGCCVVQTNQEGQSAEIRNKDCGCETF